MNKIIAFFFFLTTLCTASTWAQDIMQRVEPPFWWVGMNNPEVQLMIYGTGIAEFKISSPDASITVKAQHRLENPNYLFLDLVIDPETRPGIYILNFERSDGKSAFLRYEFKKREFLGESRKGFDPSDVLYLVTPDRFANGDPGNDEIAGMKEGLNREAEYGRHGGDIQGIADHLDYVDDMGFTAIWLNPVLENDQPEWSYHGYATTDYYKVDPRFGTNQEYRKLCTLARERGIGVIMDIIVNHCGSEHWWMKDLPSSDWINSFGRGYTQTNHRKTTLVDPYVSHRDRNLMTKGWFVPAMPDLNQENPFLSKYLIQNSIWWIENCGLYGLRQDTYSYPFREFMTDWTCAIKNEYPEMNIVGEEWTDNPAIISYWQEGKINHDGYTSCLPSLMDFPLCMTVHKALNEEESFTTGMSRIYELLANDFQYADPFNLVIFPDNHDMSRIFTQLNEDTASYKMAMVLYATMRGIPQLFYGTEILMANPGTDSHGVIRSDFPGGWQGDIRNAFNQEGMDESTLEIQAWVKSLLNWRKHARVIHTGKFMHFNPDRGCYVYFRYTEDETAMIALNKNDSPFEIDPAIYAERMKPYNSAVEVLSGKEQILENGLEIPGKTARIFLLKK